MKITFPCLFPMCLYQDDPTLITDIKSDLNEECSKFGTVKKILIFDVSLCYWNQFISLFFLFVVCCYFIYSLTHHDSLTHSLTYIFNSHTLTGCYL